MKHKQRNRTVAWYILLRVAHTCTRCCCYCCCSRFSDITHAYAWRAVRTVMPIACPIAPTAEVSPYYSAVRHIRDDRRPCWCTKPIYPQPRSPLTHEYSQSSAQRPSKTVSFLYACTHTHTHAHTHAHNHEFKKYICIKLQDYVSYTIEIHIRMCDWNVI